MGLFDNTQLARTPGINPTALPRERVAIGQERGNPQGLFSQATGELGQIFNFFAELRARKKLRKRASQFDSIRQSIVEESGATIDERADPVRAAKFSLQAADRLGDPELIRRAIKAVQDAQTLAATRDLGAAKEAKEKQLSRKVEATTKKIQVETELAGPKAEALIKEREATAALKEGQLKDLGLAAKDRKTRAEAAKLSSEAAMLRSLAEAKKKRKQPQRKIATQALQKQVEQQLIGMPFAKDADLEDTNTKFAFQQMAFHVANSIEAQLRIDPDRPFNTAFKQAFNDFKQFMSIDERNIISKLFNIGGDEAASSFDVEGASNVPSEKEDQDLEAKIDEIVKAFKNGEISREEAAKKLRALGIPE